MHEAENLFESEQDSASKPEIEVSILLPVRNEGIHLEIMLKMLNAVLDVPSEVIVIHDEPDDDCVPVVQKIRKTFTNIRTVHNTLGRGVINAIKTGVHESKGEYILIFAADELGPLLAIKDMLELIYQGCDFVSCTRYTHGGRRLGGSVLGRTLSSFANRIFSLLSSNQLTDATTGIKMFRRTVFDKLNLQANPVGWAVAFEMSIKAQLQNLKLGEVPIVSIDRLYGGKSTFRPLPWIKEYMRWLIWGIIHLPPFKKNNNQKVLIRIPKSCPIDNVRK